MKGSDLMVQSLRVVSIEQVEQHLKSRSDISNRLFDGVEIADMKAVQSLLPGVIFRDCIISNCDFSRSDFEGVRFERCLLNNVSFKYADIRSTCFGYCKIKNCDFSESFISDVVFQRTIVYSCKFDGSSILKSKFLESRILKSSNIRATILHSEFCNTKLSKINFGNCTSLYLFFDKCKFREFSINIDSLGLSYGIEIEDIQKINLIFLGGSEKKPDNFNIKEHIVDQYMMRKWYLQAMISNLNFKITPTISSWIAIFEVFKGQVDNGSGAKIDDAIFVSNIMKWAFKKKELPFLSVVFCREIVNKMDEAISKHKSIHDLDFLKLIENNLHMMFLDMRKEISKISNSFESFDKNETVHCEMFFFEKPELNVETYFMELVGDSGMHSREVRIEFYDALEGSWIKPFKTTASCLAMILVSLYLVEGCIIKLTSIKARTNVLLLDGLPVSYIEEASSPKQEIPDYLAYGMKSIYKNSFKERSYLSGSKSGITQKNISGLKIN